MKMILQERFQSRVRETMDELHWSQSELARRKNVGPDYVYRYLSGQRSPGLDVIENFANALGVDPGFLIATRFVEKRVKEAV